MYSAIAANKRNTIFIMMVFLLLIGGISWLVGYSTGDYGIAITIAAVGAIYAVIQYFLASRLAVSMSGGREITKKDNPLLWNTVENLSISAGLPMPRVFIIDDPAPNAFATGRDPKHAYVAATTGLLDIMNKRELNAVIAHEMSHVKNYDIRVSMIVFGLVAAISFISDIYLHSSLLNSKEASDNAKNPIALLFLILLLVLAPLVAFIVQMAVSRQREYLADASGALLTRDNEGLAMALEKLSSEGRPMQKQNSAMAHLYINNPLKSGFVNKLFSTHPPIEDRIARLRESGNKM